MFRIALTSLVGILLVRHLQPENYGKLSFAISFISLFTAFTSLGLDNIVIKYFVNFESKKNNIL
ncbi:MAG: Polysacc synt protein, partial [Patescibacteria group bacterium]|nr:Polysacc synt protein [Patescibacteria group bacterium]